MILGLLVTCIFIAPTARADTLADSLKKSGPLYDVRKKLGPVEDIIGPPVMTVHTPIKLVGIPADWSNATLTTGAMVFFIHPGSSEPSGYGMGKQKKQLQGTLFGPIDYQETMHIAIKEIAGIKTNTAAGLTVALLEKTDKCMVVGIGRTGNNSPMLDEYENVYKEVIGYEFSGECGAVLFFHGRN